VIWRWLTYPLRSLVYGLVRSLLRGMGL
jgi:hypothetical protein